MAIYLPFYGLERDPFGTTPDPDFLYPTHGHREALAQLTYAIQERKGFILLSAEVGTGKTTLLQALQRELAGTNTAVAYISNSMLPFNGILEYMLEEFEIAKPAESHAQRLVTLQNFLVERFRAGQATVLILDEAQNLYPQTLEQIRLLSNFETTKEKILQILLVGQPELQARLELPELHQLNQRITMRCTIPRLSGTASRNYIRSRLRLAGASDSGIFTDAALARIGEYAAGIPRVLNTICDHCLIIGYADQTRRIDRSIVEEAITYLEAGQRPRRRARRRAPSRVWGASTLRWSMVGVVLGMLAGAGALATANWATMSGAMSGALRTTTSYVSDLAQSVRTLMGP